MMAKSSTETGFSSTATSTGSATSGAGASAAASAAASTSSGFCSSSSAETAASATSSATFSISGCSSGASDSSGFAGSTSPARNDRIHASSAFQTIAKLLSTSLVSLPDFASSAHTVPKKKSCSSRCETDFNPACVSSSNDSQKNFTRSALIVSTSATGTSAAIFGNPCSSSASIWRSHSQSGSSTAFGS